MKKERKVWVTVWIMQDGSAIREGLYTNMTVREALICGIQQFLDNSNTWKYPRDMDGIYHSNMVKGRLLYNINDDIVISAQRA